MTILLQKATNACVDPKGYCRKPKLESSILRCGAHKCGRQCILRSYALFKDFVGPKKHQDQKMVTYKYNESFKNIVILHKLNQDEFQANE